MAALKSPFAACSLASASVPTEAATLVAEVGQHVLQQHPDEVFVFDHKQLVGSMSWN